MAILGEGLSGVFPASVKQRSRHPHTDALLSERGRPHPPLQTEVPMSTRPILTGQAGTKINLFDPLSQKCRFLTSLPSLVCKALERRC
jgi:hypothetical protein